jgi:hypothetical protein
MQHFSRESPALFLIKLSLMRCLIGWLKFCPKAASMLMWFGFMSYAIGNFV